MTPKSVEHILRELYAIDPSFKEHEASLKKLIEELLAHEPNIPIDEAFFVRLKNTLTQQVVELSSQSHQPSFINKLFAMKKYWFGVAGGLAIVVLSVALTTYKTPRYQSVGEQMRVTARAPRAFGQLSYALSDARGTAPTQAMISVPQTKQNDVERNAAVPVPTIAPEGAFPAGSLPPATPGAGMGVNLSAPVEDVAKETVVAPQPKAVPAAKLVINPGYYYSYSFVYKGDTFTLPDNEVTVYHRLKPSAASGDWGNLLNRFTSGQMNLGSFSNLSLMNVSLIDNTDKGYVININAVEGSIDMYQNWEKWYPTTCTNGACSTPEMKPVTKEDIPSDDEAIRIANEFLNAHGITVSNYGTPQVENYEPQFRIMDKAAIGTPTVEPAYYSDTVTVVYPLKIDGQETVENGGQKAGLRVSIAVREKRVSHLYGLTNNTYESSSYAAETDSNRIISIIEKGGLEGSVNYYAEGVRPKKVTVELGTPTRVLMHTWNYNNNESKELYVPALSFPVVNAGDVPTYYQQAIVVPLAKEMLTNQDSAPTPQPIPLIQKR